MFSTRTSLGVKLVSFDLLPSRDWLEALLGVLDAVDESLDEDASTGILEGL